MGTTLYTATTERCPTVRQTKKESASAASGERLIKKYPNRRLYDTTTSSYITLTEIKTLVLQAQPFVVRDAKSDEDLTRSILLQIILEEETGGVPLFSEQMLAHFIRSYGHSMQGFLGTYLEKNMQVFTEMQQRMQEQSEQWSPERWQQLMTSGAPGLQNMMGAYMEQSRAAMQNLQESMQAQSDQMLAAMGLKGR
jgi:polyhydroxyalkanoate synthesis repressor PhaR